MSRAEALARVAGNVSLLDVSLDERVVPLLFAKREYLPEISGSANSTSCQKTSNPDDYGVDD